MNPTHALFLAASCLLPGAFLHALDGPDACYPDPIKTPGCVMPHVTTEAICQAGYTEKVRNVSNGLKWQVFRLYGLCDGPMDKVKFHALELLYEIDHWQPLEIGGSNDIKNLFPMAYTIMVDGKNYGARRKDVVETGLHRRIKSGLITLKQAQDIIATDWVKALHEIEGGKPLTIPPVKFY